MRILTLSLALSWLTVHWKHNQSLKTLNQCIKKCKQPKFAIFSLIWGLFSSQGLFSSVPQQQSTTARTLRRVLGTIIDYLICKASQRLSNWKIGIRGWSRCVWYLTRHHLSWLHLSTLQKFCIPWPLLILIWPLFFIMITYLKYVHPGYLCNYFFLVWCWCNHELTK